MLLGGVCCLTSMILIEVSESDTDATAIAATWCSFAGKFAISGSFCALYVFAAELFSTDIRTIGVGFGFGVTISVILTSMTYNQRLTSSTSHFS